MNALISLQNKVPNERKPICQWHLERFELAANAYSKNRGPDILLLKQIFALCPTCIGLIEKLDSDYQSRIKRKLKIKEEEKGGMDLQQEQGNESSTSSDGEVFFPTGQSDVDRLLNSDFDE